LDSSYHSSCCQSAANSSSQSTSPSSSSPNTPTGSSGSNHGGNAASAPVAPSALSVQLPAAPPPTQLVLLPHVGAVVGSSPTSVGNVPGKLIKGIRIIPVNQYFLLHFYSVSHWRRSAAVSASIHSTWSQAQAARGHLRNSGRRQCQQSRRRTEDPPHHEQQFAAESPEVCGPHSAVSVGADSFPIAAAIVAHTISFPIGLSTGWSSARCLQHHTVLQSWEHAAHVADGGECQHQEGRICAHQVSGTEFSAA